MKRYTQLILTLFFLFHFFVVVIMNIGVFGRWKMIDDLKLNSLGKIIINKIPDSGYFGVIDQYANYTGIDKGHVYFAPNVIRTTYELGLINDKKIKADDIMSTMESKLKFKTFIIRFFYLAEAKRIKKEMIDVQLELIYKKIIKKHKNIKKSDINLRIKKVNRIEEYLLRGKRNNIREVNLFKFQENE